MALINITEFSELARDVTGNYVSTGCYNQHTISYDLASLDGTSEQAQVFASTTGFLQLNVDADVRFAIGTNPTATATGTRLPSGAILIIGVPRNKSFRLAARTA